MAADQALVAGRPALCEALADEALHWAETAGDAWNFAMQLNGPRGQPQA